MACHRVALRAFHVTGLFVVARALPRIVSVPDLHGDYERAMEILQAAGVIDGSGSWAGGSTSLVQTGDIADRGPSSFKIYELFARLAEEAPKHGGEVVNLLGNHELLNIQHDDRYVSKEEMKAFGGRGGWLKIWSSEGEIGKQVRRFKTAAKVGPVLFVHAGLLPSFLKDGRTIDDLNRDMMNGLAEGKNLDDRAVRDLIGDSGPVWTRFYAGSDSAKVCGTLTDLLKHVGAERMVVGHTVQEQEEGVFRVNPVCGGSLILGDTAISRAYNGEMSFIEYTADDEAVVSYPGLGIKQTLPRSPLSPKPAAARTKFLAVPAASAPVSVQAAPVAGTADDTSAGKPFWVKVFQYAHYTIYTSVALLLAAACACALQSPRVRPWLQRQKPRFT